MAMDSAQFGDRVKAGLAVEMIVGKHDVGSTHAGPLEIPRAGKRVDAAAPAFEQQPHAVEDTGVVVDAEHAEPGKRSSSADRRLGLDLAPRLLHCRDRQDDGKARAFARA